jgi:hypothetical protein
MVDVPAEIWLQIARFIPDELLNSSQMMAVCRVFLELGLDARWRNVAILTSKISQPTKLLKRISYAIHLIENPFKSTLTLHSVETHSLQGEFRDFCSSCISRNRRFIHNGDMRITFHNFGAKSFMQLTRVSKNPAGNLSPRGRLELSMMFWMR